MAVKVVVVLSLSGMRPKAQNLPAQYRIFPTGSRHSVLLTASRFPLPAESAHCQDDAVFTRGAKGYLERILWPAPQVGVISLYCPSHEHRSDISGFHTIDPGWGAWGAVAYIFSNLSVRDLLND